MLAYLPFRRPSSGSRKPGRVRPGLEQLEARNVPSSAANGVLDQAAPVSVNWVSSGGQPAVAQAQVNGTIGDGRDPSSDVSWYTFTLDRPADVAFASQSTGGSVLSLYNTDGPLDYYDPLGHRLLAQAQGDGAGTVSLDRKLGPGTYYLAVSGPGNAYFNPFLAGSGYAGAGTSYHVSLTATDLSTASPLPGVLTADVSPNPAATSPPTRSPFEIYLDLSGSLDPSVAGNLDVELHPAGDPGGANLLTPYFYSDTAHELQLQPAAPLAPGSYMLSVSAYAGPVQALAQDFSLTFQVAGTEGTAGTAASDDTPATAHPLTFTNGFAQAAGGIGDDPAAGWYSGSDVDVYHFQVSQPGRYGLVAEAFAGRIGSPLDPVLSLFEVEGGNLHLVTWNDNSNNPAPADAASPVSLPVANDPVLYAALGQGDYYLVVTGSGNQPSLTGDIPFAPDAPLDPAFAGFGLSTGNYVLNVSLEADPTPPQVVSVTPLAGGPLAAPPAAFVVQFSEPVNLEQLTFEENSLQLNEVFLTGPGGTYHPELVAYDPATNRATFALLEALPPGPYTLHLSGTLAGGGITSLGGNPLVGNDPTGATADYVVPFQVTGTGPGPDIAGGPSSAGQPQDLGLLPAFYLHREVVVSGDFAGQAADYYQLQVLETCSYTLTVGPSEGGASMPEGAWVTITDLTTGATLPTLAEGDIPPGDPSWQVNADGFVRLDVFLSFGHTYVVTVVNWGDGPYTLHLSEAASPEAPTALVVGPAPAIRQRLLGPEGPPADDLLGPPPPPGPAPGLPPAGTPVVGAPHGLTVELVSLKVDGTILTGADFEVVRLPPPLSSAPGGVLLSFSVGPGDGSGLGPGTGVGPDAFDQVFSQQPPPPGGAGHPLGQDLPTQGGDFEVLWLSKPDSWRGPVGMPLGEDLWLWLREQMGALWSMGLGAVQADGQGQDEAPPPGGGGEDESAHAGPALPAPADTPSRLPPAVGLVFAALGGALVDAPAGRRRRPAGRAEG